MHEYQLKVSIGHTALNTLQMSIIPASFVFVTNDSVTEVCFSPDNQKLLICHSSGIISLWSMANHRKIFQWKAHSDQILTISCLSGIISHGRDDRIHFWNSSEFNMHATNAFQSHPNASFNDVNLMPEWSIEVNSLNFCKMAIILSDSNETLLAFPSLLDSNKIDIYNAKLKTNVQSAIGTDGTGICMALCFYKHDNNLYLVSGYEDACIIIWNVRTCAIMTRYKYHSEPITCLDVFKSQIISGGADSRIVSVNLESWNSSLSSSVIVQDSKGIGAIKKRSDGSMLAVGFWDGTIRLFSDDLKDFKLLKHHRERVTSLDFAAPIDQDSDDEDNYAPYNSLVVGSSDGRVSLWNT